MMRWSQLALCALLLGCDGNSATDPEFLRVPLGSIFKVFPGDVASIQGTDIVVQFVTVSTDNRCPPELTCIVPGDAQVDIRVSAGGEGRRAVALHTNTAEGPNSEAVGDYVLQLVWLDPASLPRRANTYMATLIVVAVR